MEKNPSLNKEDSLAPSNVPQKGNRDVLSPLLSEYEAFIAALQQQIDVYKDEHQSLRKDLSELIIENRDLSDRLKNLLGKKLSEEVILSPSHRKESVMVANLQQQLALTVQEKDSAVEMWHLVQREVDNLEEQLKTVQDNRHVDTTQKKMDDMKKDFSEAIMMLETKLSSARGMLMKEKASREELQKKYEKTVEENASLTETLQCRQLELEAALEGQCATARKLHELEKKYTELEKQAQTFKIVENDLESALSQCHKNIDELVRKNLEAQEKVSESLQLVECALTEKEAAIIAESKIREENARLQQIMASIVEEAGVKVKEEVQNIKQQYNGKLKMLVLDMKKLEDECSEKDKKLKKEIQEKNVMENQLEQIQKEAPATASLMEKRLNMVHEELSDVRRSNLQLAIEKESLHSEIERLQESHAGTIQRLQLENQTLEQRILMLQAHLEAAVQSRNEKDVHIEKLCQHVKHLEQEREKIHLMSRKELLEWQQQHNYQQEHQELMTQLQKIQKQSDATASELEHHLEKQHSLKMKYQKAMNTLTEKFERRIKELRRESTALKKENKILETKLHNIQEMLAAQRQSQTNVESVK